MRQKHFDQFYSLTEMLMITCTVPIMPACLITFIQRDLPKTDCKEIDTQINHHHKSRALN